MGTVQFYYDFSSPNAYFGFAQLNDYLQDTNHTVEWQPVFLGGMLRELETTPAAMDNDLKANYLQKDYRRWSERLEVPFSFPSHFPLMTVKPLRGSLVIEEKAPDRLVPYVDRVFRAYWVEDQKIDEAVVLGSLVDDVGLDGDELLNDIEQPSVKEKLKERTEQALEQGVFGVPSFVVNGELYWGKDRFSFVTETLEDTTG